MAVGAGFDPGFHIRSHLVPVKPESDPVECFVGHEVPCRRGGVEGTEQSVAQRGWWDDEEEGSSVEVQGLGVGEPVVVEADEAVSEGGCVSRGKLPEDGFGKGVVGVVAEGGVDGVEGVIGKVARGPFIGGGKGG